MVNRSDQVKMNITRHQRIALCLSLLSLATTQCFEQASWKTRFIGDFFSWHGIHAITIQACPATDTLRLVKTLMLRNFWLVLKKHVGVAGYLSENHFKLGIFLEYDCDTSKQAFAEKSTTSYLRSDYQWLVWSHAFDSTHPDYNFDSDVTWATPNLHQGRVALFDAYKIDRLIVTPAGYWDSTRGITHRVKDQKYSSRSDLHGISFKAGIVVNVMPEDHIEDRLVSQTDRYTDSMARYHYALYTHLRDWFNFKMKLIVMDSYGYATANGSYNGLIGLLHSKEVELGISAVLIRHGRLKFVDYIAPTWLFCNPILFRHPKATAMPDALAQPFSAPVWLCCAACWLLVMVSLRFIVVLESRRQRTASDQTWSTACITIVEVIAEQGAEVSHKWTSWRVLFLFALVQAVILNNYYGASLVSSLVAPSTKTIRTVEDLIKSSLKVGYVNVSYNHDFFKTSSNPLIKKLYSKKVFPSSNSKPNVFSREVAVKKIKEEAFAIQAEAISLYPLIEDQFDESEKCSLAEVNAFPPNTVYSIIQKGSPYKKLFAFGLRALWERGLMKRQLHLWRPSPPQCYGANEVPGVELGAISLALVLLAAGTVTALAILVVECQLSHDRCCKRFILKPKYDKTIQRAKK